MTNPEHPNATVTVAFGDKTVTFELDGTELQETSRSRAGVVEPIFYLGNASKSFVADSVEKALIEVTA